MNDGKSDGDNAPPSTPQKASRSSLARVLPTERVSFEKQLSLLRAYAAASGAAKSAVSNSDVQKVISGLATSTISLCNPFLSDIGLLLREGTKFRPADAVFDYLHAHQWNPETAAWKLGSVLQETWFAKVLLPKLAFRQLSRDEAVSFLAEEAKAPKAFRRNLDVLIDYLCATGVVRVEGNAVLRALATDMPGQQERADPKGDVTQPLGHGIDPPKPQFESFSIPIPGKEAATISIPEDLDSEDWEMLSKMIEHYVLRLKKFEKPSREAK